MEGFVDPIRSMMTLGFQGLKMAPCYFDREAPLRLELGPSPPLIKVERLNSKWVDGFSRGWNRLIAAFT